jgi:PPK2 family polyphosphate:nucleotide phosphotransferase
MKLKSPWLVKPHTKVRLSECSTSEKHDLTPENADKELTEHRERLYKLQDILYASQSHSMLIALQGMDTAGKDGTISHIFSGINPQGCDVASFKTPTTWEKRHDFLWRCHIQAPARGQITVFNRSHYEEVLFPRVHKLITPAQARRHMDEINDFEKMLADNGTVILKFFLHISEEEQTRRLQSRIDDPKKHWKFSAGDLAERKFWKEYQEAYQDVFTHTSKKHAPWFIIPADHKSFRNLAISGIIADALSMLKLKFPKPTMDVAAIKL